MPENARPVAVSSPLAAAGESHPAIADISREIVRFHAQSYGRGPTKAKTVWRDDIVVCILQEIFTKAEEVLVASGRFEDVRSTRQAFQDVTAGPLSEIVEEATGRRVASFLSQVSVDGVASEVFVLASKTE